MSKVMIIAELSANHNGNKQIAIDTIVAAKKSGADAVKLQTYTADTITVDCRADDFKIKQGTIWDGTRLYDLYKQAYTPWGVARRIVSCGQGGRTYLFFITV